MEKTETFRMRKYFENTETNICAVLMKYSGIEAFDGNVEVFISLFQSLIDTILTLS